MTRISRLAAVALMVTTAPAFATSPSKAPPSAPVEVTAAAPEGTTLLWFGSSGNQPNADAMAVFETAPDNDDVRHRTLIVFGKKDGKFVPDFSSDRIIACSKCTQFHDDPFDGDAYVKVTPGHLHIEQADSGQKPSSTVLEFVRKAGAWQVTSATRETVVAGDGKDTTETLPIPASGLAKDMDAMWRVPVFLNTLLINRKKGDKFSFLHGDPTVDAMWKSQEGDCNREDCTILVQQQDGCISLVRDGAGRPFGAGTPDPKDKKAAVAKAMAACNAAAGEACEPVRTDCSRGIL
ncbi:DUF4189 domain-containing protein [Luteibacter sp. 3190]|uniref:DUF4189 domain-containing protein n=1 Tax=Luteibacter sp. 3190 TaxID=2817736 RepID=UPI00285F9D9C|nr:DUF4189 domain-containing protein [Luteibacter sp. 3190]MDR6935318.1 hypothetical protein [Luteibacter sp. 3190]